MGALMGLLSSKGGAAMGQQMAQQVGQPGSTPPPFNPGGPQFQGGAGGIGGMGTPPQVAPGIIQMAPGLQGPTMGAQDATAAGLGMSGAPGSPYGGGGGGYGGGGAMSGLLSHLAQSGAQQKDAGANKFMEMLQGFSPNVRAILGFMQKRRAAPQGGFDPNGPQFQ